MADKFVTCARLLAVVLALSLSAPATSVSAAPVQADPVPGPSDSPFPSPSPIAQPDPVNSGPTAPLPPRAKGRRGRTEPRPGGAANKTPPSATPSPTPNADAIANERDESVPSNGERIQKVEIRGNQKIDRDAVLEKVRSSAGSPLDEEQVRKDIVAIHKLGYFDSIRADFENGTLIFTVKERPAIYRILFTGNEQVSTDDLKGTLTIKTYDIYDENLIRESVRKLTKYYEDKGFYLAKVDFTTRPSTREKDMVEVLFRVREYEKVKIRKITFLGNKAFTDDQLKRTLRNTAENGFFSWVTSSGNFKELDFKNDLQVLQYWYLNEGYVRFRYEPPVVSVSEDKKWVYITIKVDEGNQYRIGNIDFDGDLLFPKEELNQALTLKSGDVFSISKRNADIVALTEKYQDLGYANVNVVPNIDVNDETRLVNTTYTFEKGSLVHFGRITIKGNSKTRDKVVRRELKIHEGELYSGSGMRVSKENVERLGFFENDSVQFQTKSPPGRPDLMDVEIALKERPTGQFQLGAGYATTTGVFFTTQISETNLFGKGQELRLAAQVSARQEDRSFSLSFTDPYAWDTNWSVGGSLSYDLVQYPDNFVEFRRGFQFTLGRPISDYTRFYTGYRLESIRYKEVQDPDLGANLGFENGTISAVSATLVNDKRNNRLETTGGHYIRWNEEAAGLGGNRRFLRTNLEGRIYRKIWGELTFRSKIEGGSIWDYGGIGVQRNERFFLGGSNNLRGYNFNTVGPLTNSLRAGAPRFVAGGLHQAFFMSELEYPIARELGLKFVVFYDAGDAFDKLNQISVKQDIGWGFRWFSPLGPLRFEWGYPLKKVETSPGSQFNFMIGPPF